MYWKSNDSYKKTTLKTELANWSTKDEGNTKVNMDKGKALEKYEKELVTAIWGDRIYHTWRETNWTIYRETTKNTEITFVQIIKR